MTATSLTVVAAGVLLTISPVAHTLGYTALPRQFYAVLALFVVVYLVLVESAKKMFYAESMHPGDGVGRTRRQVHRIHRRAARFSHRGSLTGRLATS